MTTSKKGDLLIAGDVVYTDPSGIPCTVEQFLGGGGQGEVYRANFQGKQVALKWYFPHTFKYDPYLHERLEQAINTGAPSDRFLWPIELTIAKGKSGFGYIMPLRESRYKSMIDLMTGRVGTTFRALATAGFQLADSFFQLHAKGLCYCDISFGNIFFEPDTGHILICDNDNVDINNQERGAVKGTLGFMAPEVMCDQARPSRQTDSFSLAILLFYMFIRHHPLEGKKEADIVSFDLEAKRKLYGEEPIFIFDPDDDSNRPVPGYQDNALVCWPLFPPFLRDLFTKAFTDGIRNPNGGRVEETEWRLAMIRLRDSIIYCPHCGAENFYDREFLKTSGGKLHSCWSCQSGIVLPPRIRIGKNIIMLTENACLFPHHIDKQKRYNFSSSVAIVIKHPTKPNVWGLKNLSNQQWVITIANQNQVVAPGKSVLLAKNIKINFGKVEGEVQV